MEVNDNYYDSLLDDPVDNSNGTGEFEEVDPNDNIPMIPDQDDSENPDNTGNGEGDGDGNGEGEGNQPEDDLITSYLKSRGIEDPSKIKFETDEGETEDRDWNSLSKEEQLTMLQELSSSDYTDYERNVIDYLRKSGTDLQGVIDYFQKKAIDDYLAENPDKVRQKEYKIDDYSDDELYISDLKLKFPEFTDEELNERLESAKVNEELFKKEVDALRTYYKEQEENEEKEAQERAQQEYETLQNSLLTAASRFTEIKFDVEDAEDPGGFEIEDDDRQRALAYLLAVDKDGQSQFDKDLSDPNALFELAYLRTSARDLLNGTSQYYKKVITETRKELAKTKKALEKYEKKGNNSTVTTKTEPTGPKTKPTKIEDLWG